MQITSNKKSSKNLLLGYWIWYPASYVLAMFFTTVILTFIFDWSFQFAEKIFYILAIMMWFLSYIINFDILRHALSLRKPHKQILTYTKRQLQSMAFQLLSEEQQKQGRDRVNKDLNEVELYSLTEFVYDGLDRLTSTTGNSGIGSSKTKQDTHRKTQL